MQNYKNSQKTQPDLIKFSTTTEALSDKNKIDATRISVNSLKTDDISSIEEAKQMQNSQVISNDETTSSDSPKKMNHFGKTKIHLEKSKILQENHSISEKETK